MDWLLEQWGIKGVRYADDLVLLARSAEEARRALERLREWAEEARLTLHPEKTRLVDMGEGHASFDFLGYRFKRSGKGKLLRLVRPKSQRNLRQKLKSPLRRANGRSMAAIVAKINPVLKGWFEYFQQAQLGEHQRMDQWVRMRLRSILRKRHKGKGRGRGCDHFKWPNRYFDELGLFTLEGARRERMSLHERAKC